MHKSITAILLFSIVTSTSHAVMLKGVRSCGSWVAEKPAGRDRSITRLTTDAWFGGFISGLAASSSTDFLKDVDAVSIEIWVDNYCQANPLNSLADAGTELALELMKRKRE